MAIYEVFTDGHCWPNPGPGGWGWVILDARGRVTLYGRGDEDATTNNRMEIQAVIEALNSLPYDSTIVVRSDSLYAIGFAMAKKKKKRKNGDLVEPLQNAIARHDIVYFVHVKGHSGVKGNELADKLAGGQLSV